MHTEAELTTAQSLRRTQGLPHAAASSSRKPRPVNFPHESNPQVLTWVPPSLQRPVSEEVAILFFSAWSPRGRPP